MATLSLIGSMSDQQQSHGVALEQIEHLPLRLQIAVRESGILDQADTDFSWLKDQRAIEALTLADEAHAGKKRKYGQQKTRLIHEIWCAHQIYNNDALNAWAVQQNLPPLLPVFGMLSHDCLENVRDVSEKKGIEFDKAAVLARVARAWGDDESFAYIQSQCLEYMTDAPELHGHERIMAQRDKGYDAEGNLRLTPLQQCWRMYDKLSHVVLDAQECATNGLPLAAAREALEGATWKSFVLDFPMARPIRAQYAQAMSVLQAGIDACVAEKSVINHSPARPAQQATWMGGFSALVPANP